MPRCRSCKKKFIPRYFLQKHCLDNTECIKAMKDEAVEKERKKKAKEWKREKKQLKEKLKTHSDYIKEVQKVFNEYIRLRDKLKGCISCGKKDTGQYHAGHYRSAGGNPELRFEELNVWKQCATCNTYLHGNLINYRINLIKEIGVKKVEWLEGKHEPRKYSILELKELKQHYKSLIKQMK